jgi:hypothetical protein
MVCVHTAEYAAPKERGQASAEITVFFSAYSAFSAVRVYPKNRLFAIPPGRETSGLLYKAACLYPKGEGV